MTATPPIERDAYWRLSVSYHRALLNRALQQQSQMVHGTVLDIGGEKYSTVLYRMPPQNRDASWLYLNVSHKASPDILADGARPPLRAESVDTVLCLETLEHLSNPEQVIREIARILRPGGTVLVGLPFLYPIHAAPEDYWRFTSYQAQRMLQEAGLDISKIFVLGRFFTVLGDMIKHAIAGIRFAPVRWLLWIPMVLPVGVLVFLEQRGLGQDSPTLRAFSTGYLICATKASSLDTPSQNA